MESRSDKYRWLDLEVLTETANKNDDVMWTCADLAVESMIWTYNEAALENGAENGGQECSGGPCSLSLDQGSFFCCLFGYHRLRRNFFLKKIRLKYLHEKYKVLLS